MNLISTKPIFSISKFRTLENLSFMELNFCKAKCFQTCKNQMTLILLTVPSKSYQLNYFAKKKIKSSSVF